MSKLINVCGIYVNNIVNVHGKRQNIQNVVYIANNKTDNDFKFLIATGGLMQQHLFKETELITDEHRIACWCSQLTALFYTIWYINLTSKYYRYDKITKPCYVTKIFLHYAKPG